MELVEPIERINDWLAKEYGIDTISSRPIYRVVWSNDQFEKRLSKYTAEGLELLTPRVIEVPKYKQWAKDRYILERLSYIDVDQDENAQMTVERISYEPIWSFVDNKLNYLPPRIDVCKIIIDGLHAAIHGDHSLAKYKDKNPDPEEERDRIAGIQKELFGNETDTGDALAHGEAIVVPRNFRSENEKVH